MSTSVEDNEMVQQAEKPTEIQEIQKTERMLLIEARDAVKRQAEGLPPRDIREILREAYEAGGRDLVAASEWIRREYEVEVTYGPLSQWLRHVGLGIQVVRTLVDVEPKPLPRRAA
ncbi:MAG TPA: hypothetical protein VFU47_16390 [Armatimonadota bacterium]|nr:hypothetical protein [Armatimonadota bacterium]